MLLPQDVLKREKKIEQNLLEGFIYQVYILLFYVLFFSQSYLFRARITLSSLGVDVCSVLFLFLLARGAETAEFDNIAFAFWENTQKENVKNGFNTLKNK